VTLISIFLIAFLYPIPDIKNWISQYPFLLDSIKSYSTMFQQNEPVLMEEEMVIEWMEPLPVETAEVVPSPVDWRKTTGYILLGVYLLVAGLMVIRCAIELFSVFYERRKSKKRTVNGIDIWTSPQIEEPYSFFKWIFINPEKYNQRALSEIIIHENTHVRQYHSIDVLLGEIVSILCWINPIAWLLKEEISINHEYMADQEVMNAGFDKKEYQYHLIGLEHTPTAAANLYNYFSVLPLKKRITMLNKKRTHQARILKYLALLPMAAGLLVINNMDAMARIVDQPEPVVTEAIEMIEEAPVSAPETIPAPLPPDDNKIYTMVDKMPQFPGGDVELLKFINENLKYPITAQEQGIEGRVVASFTVEKDGSINDVEIVRSLEESLDNESIRILKSLPKWTPGENNGKIVRVKFTVPIQFRLSRAEKREDQLKQFEGAEETINGEKVHHVVDKMPKYPGGDKELMNFVSANLKYPADAQEKKMQGRVVVTYVVQKDGTLSNFKVVRSVSPSLDQEAVRVISSMPRWEPGMNKGEKVHVKYTMPIVFKL